MDSHTQEPEEDEALVAAAWAEEIERRKEALHSGADRAVPWEEARARFLAM